MIISEKKILKLDENTTEISRGYNQGSSQEMGGPYVILPNFPHRF